MSEPIVVNDLAKRYSDGTEAVRGVSFTVAAGEIVGLVGPNGAGKSTVLNMLATLIRPTSGDARVFGVPVTHHASVRPLLGVALQAAGLDPLMSVSEHLDVHAALYGMRSRAARLRSRELLDAFQLGPVRNRRAGELSGGTARRLALALALLHSPRAIIFDEPTVGLDPNARRAVWELLTDLRSQGLAVLFSTHYMDEAERLCQRIELMSKGWIVASGSPADLKARAATAVLRLRLRAGADRVDDALRLAATRGILPHRRYTVTPDAIEIHTQLSDFSVSALLSLLEEFGVSIVDLHWGHGTLDDVFTRLAESTADEDRLPAVRVEHRALARRGGTR